MGVLLVVFDIAGTTVKDNNNVAIAFQEALAKFGFMVPLEQINPLMGYEKNEAIRAILRRTGKTEEDLKDDLVAQIHQVFVELMIAFYETTDELSPLPHVESTFLALKEMGVYIALNTGFSRNITDIIVRRLGWLERSLIDEYIASDEVEKGRPDPAMIQQLMQRLHIDSPQQVMKVGDTEVDINEGHNANCKYVVAVTTGAYAREELEKHAPTHIIDNIADILPLVENSHA